jgi:5-methylcytosine-specific restriction endonuclease McrA
MLYSGGYPARDRRLTAAQRDAILDRDHRTCTLCGAPGTEIDHITDSSEDPGNLRALCRSCNLGEAAKQLTVADAQTQEQIREYVRQLAERVAAVPALQICDDEVRWPQTYRSVMKERRATLGASS